jgi:hypothetical protein
LNRAIVTKFLPIKSGCGLAGDFRVFPNRAKVANFAQFDFWRESSLKADCQAIRHDCTIYLRVADN